MKKKPIIGWVYPDELNHKNFIVTSKPDTYKQKVKIIINLIKEDEKNNI